MDQVTVGFLAMALLISVLVASISGVALHEAQSNTSDSYKTSVQWFGGICMATAFAVLIASPIVAGLKGRTLGFFILAVLLSSYVVAVSAMAIHESNSETGDSYKNAVKGVSGAGVAAAGIGVIAVFVLAYRWK